MIIRAEAQWNQGDVGCFHSYLVAHRLIEAFPEATVCLEDSFLGRRDDLFAIAREVLDKHGHYPDVPVQTGLRNITNFSPRYSFKITTAPDTSVSGSIDRYCVQVVFDSNEQFPEEFQRRFIRFLESLSFGQPRIWQQ